MKIKYRVFTPSQLRSVYDVTVEQVDEAYKNNSTEKLLGLNKSDEMVEFMTDEDETYDGAYTEAVIRLVDDVPKAIVWRVHHIEPEDAKLYRDLAWTIEELEWCSNVINEQADLIKKMKETINAGVRF